LEIDDEMTSGFTALGTRVRSWWRLAVSGATEREALRLAQQLLELPLTRWSSGASALRHCSMLVSANPEAEMMSP
jgi:hypothetical protein